MRRFLNVTCTGAAVWMCWAAVLCAQVTPDRSDAVGLKTEAAETNDAQEAPASDGAAGDADATAHPASGETRIGPGRSEFNEVFAKWKNLLKDLRDLQQQFAIAAEDETDAIREHYLLKIEQGQSMVDQLRDSGVKAYAEAPGVDRELTRFLLSLAADDVARDDYDRAWDICDVMMQSEIPDKSLYDLAGVTAFATHRFDLAEEYFDQAKSFGVLKLGETYVPSLDDVRTAWFEEQKLRKAESEADDLPRVRLETNKGDVVVELFENEAPDTVGNFVNLVEQGFYNGLVFHRVLPGFVAQAGCPRGDGSGGPGYNIYCECYRDDHRKHFRGTLSMAKGPERDTGGSQFFLTLRPTPHLNGMHTVFGRVIEGMDVLAKLQRRDPDNAEQTGITPDRIVKATVIRKRNHPYEPNRTR